MGKQTEFEQQYGIKYRVIPLDKCQYILFPVSLVKGEEVDGGFRTEKGILPIAYDSDFSKQKYVVDNVFDSSELEFVYDYSEDDEFLGNYFFDDYKDVLLYAYDEEKEGYTSINEINLRMINEGPAELAYVLDRGFPAVVLNENALNELLQGDDIDEIKIILTKYKQLLKDFRGYNRSHGITKINVIDGKIDTVETKRPVDRELEEVYKPKEDFEYSSKSDPSGTGDVSYQGLKQYIKERVFGHDEEIDTFAQILFMNYTATPEDIIESILLVGPTGVGKTETVHAACEYLDIPYYEVNASNIVPQGIKGMSIEDVIVGLFENAGHDEKKAERGLIFLDEFDKLNESDLETKAAVKNILLTFTAGGMFPIDNDRYTFQFNSRFTSKVYAGVFQDIVDTVRHIGFQNIEKPAETLSNEELMRQKIIEKGYFTLEELSRISTLLGYQDLDVETKKRILLYSKLSELVKRRERYQRQFGVELIADESYVDAVIESLAKTATGMRSVNNRVKKTIHPAERALLESEKGQYKRLVLTRKTVDDAYNFDLD